MSQNPQSCLLQAGGDDVFWYGISTETLDNSIALVIMSRGFPPCFDEGSVAVDGRVVQRGAAQENGARVYCGRRP